jgi:hypothetical protein
MISQKAGNRHIASFLRKPESCVFGWLLKEWTPVFTGVTTAVVSISVTSRKDGRKNQQQDGHQRFRHVNRKNNEPVNN